MNRLTFVIIAVAMMVACGSSRKTETNDGKGGVYVNGKKLDKETGDRVIEVLNGVAGNGNDVISVTMDDRHIAGGSAHASKSIGRRCQGGAGFQSERLHRHRLPW